MDGHTTEQGAESQFNALLEARAEKVPENVLRATVETAAKQHCTWASKAASQKDDELPPAAQLRLERHCLNRVADYQEGVKSVYGPM